MRPRTLSLVLGLSMLAGVVSLGCNTRSSRSATRGSEAREEPPSTAAPPGAAVEPPSSAGDAPAPVEISFETIDHIVVHGSLYPAADPSAPAVVLVHQLASSRAEWAPLLPALREAPALTVLAIDLRGHGESLARADGSPVSYGDFGPEQWAQTSDDVAGAVAYLRSDEAPVHPARIALVGASIGATAVVRAAAEDQSLDVLVTLSPGRAYRGVDSILVALSMGPRGFLGVAAREELDSVETAEALSRITRGRTELVDGSAHGAQLLVAHPELIPIVAAFLREGVVHAPWRNVEAPTEPTPSPTGGAEP